MTYLLCYLVYFFLMWGLTWLFYLAACATYWAEAHNGLIPDWKVNLVRKTAAALSCSLNWTVFFFILPKKKFFSGTLQMHIQKSKGWRYKLCNYFGNSWLNPFDPTGKHV